jgi:hypothetical protein
MQEQAERVVVGMDPHKRSATIEVMTGDETVLGGGRFANDEAGFAAMVTYVNAIQPDPERRVWAVEVAAGSGTTSRCGCLLAASRSSTCPRNYRPGRGSSPPARAARPTPPTPTPWP